MRKKLPNKLRCQGVRLPQSALARLEEVAEELGATGGRRPSGSEVTRGLVLLALYCDQGTAGARLAKAFRLAASEPTEEGVRRALDELTPADPEAPVTEPEPPTKTSPQ